MKQIAYLCMSIVLVFISSTWMNVPRSKRHDWVYNTTSSLWTLANYNSNEHTLVQLKGYYGYMQFYVMWKISLINKVLLEQV